MDDSEILEALRREAEGKGPDAVWLQTVTRVVCQVERRPADEVADTIQDLFLLRLLRNDRALAIAQRANNLGHAQYLIRMQLSQLKSDQREKNAAERVTNRVADLIGQRLPTFGDRSTSGFGDPLKARRLRDHEVDRAARCVLQWRRLPDAGPERASRVFDGVELERGLEQLLEILGANFYKSDIYGIFFRAFTALGLTPFITYGDSEDLESDAPALTAEEARIVNESVGDLERTLSETQIKVLTLWITRDSQEERATELDISRPTLIKRQKEARDLTAAIIGDLPQHLGEAALQELISRNRYL